VVVSVVGGELGKGIRGEVGWRAIRGVRDGKRVFACVADYSRGGFRGKKSLSKSWTPKARERESRTALGMSVVVESGCMVEKTS